MVSTISTTNFNFPKQKSYYKGKVREVYNIDDNYLVMIVSDRVSAFDVVLPRAIPFKGQVLNKIAAKAMEAAKDIVPNWILNVPHPNVTIGRKCEPFKVEMVIRGYLSGHAARQYKEGKRILCGEAMADGMKENDRFPKPIITPSTKADVGHDEDITREDIIKHGLVSEADYIQLENYTQALFQRGTEIAAKHGLILVDTKYEFGKTADGKIYLIDEIHTPDSSRYFYADGYEERQKNGEPQRQLSKEFLREWLIANNFQGKEGQTVPAMTDEWVMQISDRYIELYEKLTGESFERKDDPNILGSIEACVLDFLNTH
ncbi:MAG: phosphoribosylaminoimidazolesuccinocarboxamide synthase [Bacteroidota bacterium]